MVSCARGTGLAMRVAILMFALVGVAFIIQGCVLQNPPKDYGPAMFVAVGSLNLFASLLGFWGSYHKKKLLLLFIIFGGISVIIQIAFVISLHMQFDKVVNAIEPPSEKNEDGTPKDPQQQEKHDEASRDLNIMRWVLLGFLFFELLTLVLAVLLKWVIKEEDNRYRGFDDDTTEQRAMTLANMKADVEKRTTVKEKAYDKIREKMAAKYGAVGDGNDWKSKTKMSWR